MTAKIQPRISNNRTKLEEVIPLDTPYLVFVDPSDICNFSCSWCPTGVRASKHARHLMYPDEFKRVLENLEEFPDPIKTLRLYKDGEPFCNPNFHEIVEMARLSEIALQIDTTTNGSMLTKRRIALDKIFISVPNNYKEIPGYVERIMDFREANECVMSAKIISDNMTEEQKAEFISLFDFCDEISFEHYAPCWPGFDVKEANRGIGIYGNELTDVSVCPYIFYSMSINSDLSVSLCFLDWKHNMILGNLNKNRLIEIWNGSYLFNIRKAHLMGDRKNFAGCESCGQLTHGAPDNIDKYANKILEAQAARMGETW